MKQIKNHLKSLPAIRFKGIVQPKEKNPSDLLRMFFTYNLKNPTVYVSSGELQTSHGRRRSIGDIYLVVSFYFPKVRLTTIYETLMKMIEEGLVISSICQQTGLRVYRGTSGNEQSYLNGLRTDEYTVDLTQFTATSKCREINGNWGYNYNEKNIKFIEIS